MRPETPISRAALSIIVLRVIAANPMRTSEQVREILNEWHPSCRQTVERLLKFLEKENLIWGDAVVTQGAGQVWSITPLGMRELQKFAYQIGASLSHPHDNDPEEDS